MRKILFFLFFTASVIGAKAQNVQLHYDFGETRKLTTATIEMFKPDDFGSTFFFVDMDFGGTDRVPGMNLAYFEIARGLKFWEKPLEINVEYNGGFLRNDSPATDSAFYDAGYPLNSSYLIGPSFTINSADWSKILTIKALYKYIQNQGNMNDFNNSNFQITAVWTMHFFDEKLTFCGFADFWTEKVGVIDETNGFETAEFVFLTEPQLWYNVNKNLSLGGEIEMSSNFALNKGFMVNPTLAAKWNF